MIDHGTLFAVVTWIVPLIVAITFHEVAHGYTAWYFGDPTAHDAGRLSLDPLAHVDAFGTVILPMILILTGAPVFRCRSIRGGCGIRAGTGCWGRWRDQAATCCWRCSALPRSR